MDWILPSTPSLLTTLMILSGKASILLGLALLIRATLRQTSASSRYFLISATVIMAACLPLLAPVVPHWEPPLPTVIQSHLTSENISSILPASPPNAPKTESSENILSTGKSQTLPASGAPRRLVLYIWLLGTAVTVGRVLFGMAGCLRIRRKSLRLDSKRILEIAEKASRRIGLRRIITIMISARANAPYVSGIFRPVLFLPPDVLRWPEERLMSILLHELAHVKRGDHVAWPLVNFAVSWLWFNPLVWMALAQMKRDREKACDDQALACGNSEAGYAQHLLEACTTLKASVRLAPVSLLFARKNEVKERIVYMLSHKIDRRPISRAKQVSLAVFLMILTIPLISITGFSATIILQNVSPQERDAVVTTLEEFYAELSDGTDYQIINERFLTTDYFANPNLTLENLDKAVWRPVFDNTLSLISEAGVGMAREVRGRIISMQRDGEEIVATQQLNVVADSIGGVIKYRDEDGNIVRKTPRSSARETAVKNCRLVNSLTQTIRLRHEDGLWKISRFDDGVAIMRMDTDNPYGPIFLVWMENMDSQTTPFGAGIFKVIPRDIVPDAHNAKFFLEK